MRRSLHARLRIMWLFVTTTRYDKPGTRNLRSIKWWRSCWRDTALLGN